MIVKDLKENKQQIPDPNFYQKVEKTVESFCSRNSISSETMNSERYLVNFRDKLSNTANRICKSVLGEEDVFDAFLSEMIAADYLEALDWKSAAEDVIYNYNLLSQQLNGTEIDLEIDNNTPPDEVFRAYGQ